MTSTQPSSKRWLAIGAGILAITGLAMAGGYQALSYYATRRAEAALQQFTGTLPPGMRLTWTKLTVDPLRRAATLDDTTLTAPQFTVPFGRVTISDIRSDSDAVTRAALRIEPGAVDLVSFGKQSNLVTLVLGTPLRWSIGAGYDVVEPTIDIGFDYSAADNRIGATLGLSAPGFGRFHVQGVLDQVTPTVLASIRQLGEGLPSAETLNTLSAVGLERFAGSMQDGGLVARMALLQMPQAVYSGGDVPKQLRDDLARTGAGADERTAIFRFLAGQADSLRIQSTSRIDTATVHNLLTIGPFGRAQQVVTITN